MNALLAELTKLIPLVGLVSLRVAVVFALLPAPFGDLAPARTRAVLSVVLAYVLCLPQLGHLPDTGSDGLTLAMYGLGELAVGAVIGLTVRVTLAAVEMAGTLAGNAMGLGFAQSIDPIFGGESLPTTTLYGMLGTLIFFSLRGHHTTVEALAYSLRAAPVGHVFEALSLDAYLRLGTRMVAQGLRIASPVMSTMFVLQLGAALVARAAPRVQLFALSFAVTISAGVWVSYTAAPSLARSMAAEIAELPELLAAGLIGGAP